MARVLITGGSGFIGTNLVELHVAKGDQVVNVDIEEARIPERESLRRSQDILDASGLKGVFSDFRPEIVYHLAARTDIDGKTLEDYAANTQGVSHVVACCQEFGVRRLVAASSQLVNPLTKVPKDDFDYDPPNAYGASKVETERIIRTEAEGLDWVMVRPTTIWGPWFGVKYQGLYRQVKAGRFMLPSGIRIQKIWGYVENTAWSLDQLAHLPSGDVSGRIFYLADYEPYDLESYAELIREESGSPAIRRVPYGALKGIALVGDVFMKLGKSFPLHSYRLKNFMANMKVSIAPLAQATGPAPYSLREGVRRTLDWMEKNPGFNRDASIH